MAYDRPEQHHCEPHSRQADARRRRGEVGRAVEGGRHVRFRPHEGPGRRLLDRHPAPHRLRLTPRRSRLQLHPHRHDRPLPADAGQGRLLPDGLGRQRPADRATGPELLRRPLRSLTPLPGRLRTACHRRRLPEGTKKDDKRQVSISRPNFIELCDRARRRGREGLRGPLPTARSVGRLESPLRHDRRAQPPSLASAASSIISPTARPTSFRRRACGTSPSRPRSPRPSWKTGIGRAPTTSFDSPSLTDPTC